MKPYVLNLMPCLQRADIYIQLILDLGGEHSFKKYEWIFLTSVQLTYYYILIKLINLYSSIFRTSSTRLHRPQHSSYFVNASNSPASVVAYASSELDKSNQTLILSLLLFLTMSLLNKLIS